LERAWWTDWSAVSIEINFWLRLTAKALNTSCCPKLPLSLWRPVLSTTRDAKSWLSLRLTRERTTTLSCENFLVVPIAGLFTITFYYPVRKLPCITTMPYIAFGGQLKRYDGEIAHCDGGNYCRNLE